MRSPGNGAFHLAVRASCGLWLACVMVIVWGHVALGDDDVRLREFLDRHCLECHDGASDPKTPLALEHVNLVDVSAQAATLERVVHKLRVRQMPPVGHARPSEDEYVAILSLLVEKLDRHAAVHPNPGRTETFRRLTRTEFRNAIRDLLALDVDVETLLPADESSHGFDNVTVGDLSPTLLDRYITAAQRISRLAVGSGSQFQTSDTIRLPADLTQEDHVEGLPPGTRGGMLIAYTFPVAGEYDIQIRLTRDRNEQVEGLRGKHELEVLLDRERAALFTIVPPDGDGHQDVDAHLKTRIKVAAGPHDLGVTFLKKPTSLLETKRQPSLARYNFHRHPRATPAVFQLTITGPYNVGESENTPSRQRIFTTYPVATGDEEAAARTILSNLQRRAFRREPTTDEADKTFQVYATARAASTFDESIEAALSSILVSPQFLFRIERDPPGVASGMPYRIDDGALASRLSFFLWNSLPDDELLELANSDRLHEPEILEQQVRRMLADERASSLATNFASQWLYLRNLDAITPDGRLYPDFDDNLRDAFRRETEMFFDSLLREDRKVTDLIRADYTFLNERLAKHYGIGHVYGSRFRRVKLDEFSHRGGLLRQGSILTVTSYATRTSPVIRGNWILKNILGAPAPPPPPDVPDLKDNTVSASLPIRERLAQHRADPACASCHNLMDPVGFSLENYDAVGRWRELEEGLPIDVTGSLPGGGEFQGVAGLEDNLLQHPDLLATTIAEKLLTYALGRGIEPNDAPAVRLIVRETASDDYRLSALILAVVRSQPFQMRTAQ